MKGSSPASVRFLFAEGLAALRRSWRGGLLAALLAAVTIFSAGLFNSIGSGLASVARAWAARSMLVVYLAPGAPEEEIVAVERTIRESRLSGAIRRVSPDEAIARFVRLYGGLAGAATRVGKEAFPASVEADLPAAVGEGERRALLASLTRLPGVEEIQHDREWVAALDRFARVIRAAGLVLLLLLGAGAALTSAGAMRLSLFAAEDEIRVLHLVGATEAVIAGPYLVAGAIVGFAGSLAAVGSLYVLLAAGARLLSRTLPILAAGSFPVPGIAEAAVLVLLGPAATVTGAWAAAREARKIR
jgi:cell division transport system permease protein